jgi:hypothetical protein
MRYGSRESWDLPPLFSRRSLVTSDSWMFIESRPGEKYLPGTNGFFPLVFLCNGYIVGYGYFLQGTGHPFPVSSIVPVGDIPGTGPAGR